jgi:hypothetical protein
MKNENIENDDPNKSLNKFAIDYTFLCLIKAGNDDNI